MGAIRAGSTSVPLFPETPTDEWPPGTTDDPDSGTADLQPCDLLSAQDLTALGLPGCGVERDVGPARSCQWQTSGSHTVSVGVIDELGIDGVRSDSTPAPLDVGSHRPVQYVGVLGTCAVAIEVTDSSRVDVLGSAGGDMTKACGFANQAAELVEPKLR